LYDTKIAVQNVFIKQIISIFVSIKSITMTMQQLEYIVAVDRHRHFVKAAESCFVTQSTLSAMIHKLESELNAVIFDRNAHPVVPTPMGEKIIAQAKVILFNKTQLEEIVRLGREGLNGTVRMGIIPTVAPYVLPKFLKETVKVHPEMNMEVTETRTSVIIQMLKKAELDMAILATPLEEEGILEIPLYYEKFVAYISPTEPIFKKKEIRSSEMPTEHMWVLQEGHCLRNQVFNFCDRGATTRPMYEAGSIDTLVKIVDENGGYTVIPELHVDLLGKAQLKNVRPLTSPQTVREISLIFRGDYVREGVLNAVADIIKTIIPAQMVDNRLKKFAIKL